LETGMLLASGFDYETKIMKILKWNMSSCLLEKEVSVSRRNSKTKMKKFDGEKIVIKIGFA
jgi:hypothetical protein